MGTRLEVRRSATNCVTFLSYKGRPTQISMCLCKTLKAETPQCRNNIYQAGTVGRSYYLKG